MSHEKVRCHYGWIDFLRVDSFSVGKSADRHGDSTHSFRMDGFYPEEFSPDAVSLGSAVECSALHDHPAGGWAFFCTVALLAVGRASVEVVVERALLCRVSSDVHCGNI